MDEVPVLIRLSYVIGFKILAFSKQLTLPDKPFYGLTIDDEVCDKDIDRSIAITLENTDSTTTEIHYNTAYKMYRINIANRVYGYFKHGTVNQWLEHYAHCNWNVETDIEAINDFRQSLEHQINN